MSKSQERLNEVAKRLEDLSLEHDMPELAALSDELGTIVFPQATKSDSVAVERGRRAEQALEQIMYTLVKSGVLDYRRMEDMARHAERLYMLGDPHGVNHRGFRVDPRTGAIQ